MAFGKTIAAEPLDLLEAALGEGRLVATLDQAPDHQRLVLADGAEIAEGRHGAAQAVGFRIGEFRRRHGELHRLLLEERHAQGAVQDMIEFVLLPMSR